jgi:hypothetical protein
MVDKTIRVKIQGLVAGLNDVLKFASAIQSLQTAPAGGGGVSAKAGEMKALAGEIQNLSDAVKKLEPSRLRKFFEVAGGAGALISGVSKYRQAVGQLQNIKTDAGNVFARVSAKAQEFGEVIGGKVTAGVESLTSKLPGLTGGLGASAGGLAAVGAGGAVAATGIGLIVVGVVALVAVIATLATAIPIALNLLSSLFQKGVDYNSQLEQTRLGIAAIIASLAEMESADGQKLSGADALAAGFELAGDQLAKLKVDAINTTATFEQIAPAFQAGLGPGLAAGLSLDQIRQTTVQIVQAAGSLGIPMHQVNQEVRAILEGTINEDARLAKVLGISNEMVKKWKEQGTLAEELNKRLDKFTLAGERAANTLDGLKSNLQEALNVFSGDATDQAFEVLKGRIQKLLPQLFDFKNARLDQSFQPLSDLLDGIFSRAINIAGDVIEKIISGVKRVSLFLGENKSTISAILDAGERIIGSLLRMVGHLFNMSRGTDVWKDGLGLAHGVLLIIEGVLSVVEQKIRQVADVIKFAVAAAHVALPQLFQLLQVMQAIAGTSASGGGTGEVKAGVSLGKPRITGTLNRPKATGGGKGKGDKGARLEEQLEESALGVDRAKIERAFNLAKAALEEQTRFVEQNLDARRISIGRFYDDQERIQRETIDAEKKKLDELYALEERRRDQAKGRIDKDKNLSAPEKETQKKIEDNKFAQAVIPAVERLKILDGERLALAERIAIERKKELEAFEQMLAEVNEQLALETGDIPGAIAAAAVAIDRANKDRLAQIAAEKGVASTEYQQALQLVDVLKKKAEFQLLYNQLRQQQADLDFAEEQIRNDVERGTLTERQGREEVTAAQLKHRDAVVETIDKLKELAAATGDAQLILDAERAAEGIKDLGKVVDEEAIRINASLKDAVKDTIFDIIRDPQNAMSAITRLFNHILDELARLATSAIMEQLFGKDGLLGGIFGGKSGGGLGGILSGIFGGGGSQQQGGSPVGGGTPPFIGSLFGILNGFQQGTTNQLRGIGSNTGGTLEETRFGFSRVEGRLSESVGLLGQIALGIMAMAAAAVANTVTNILKTVGILGSSGTGAATGGFIADGPGTETSDSIFARLSKHEFVVRAAAVRKVGVRVLDYINSVGQLPPVGLALGGLVGEAVGAAGLPFSLGGDNYYINAPLNIQTPNPAAFKQSDQSIKRDHARNVQDGVRRAKSRPKV